jgi:hypothetical protein
MDLLEALVVPIMLLNIFGGIIATIWLIAIREWPLVVISVIAVLIMSFIIGIVLLPAALFALPGIAMVKKGTGILGHFLIFCGLLYTYGLLWFWSMLVFWWFINQFEIDGGGLIPLMLMAYVVATAPVAIMASKDREPSTAATITTFSIMAGCMIYMLLLIFGANLGIVNLVFMGVVAIGLFSNFVISVQITTEMRLSEDRDVN